MLFIENKVLTEVKENKSNVATGLSIPVLENLFLFDYVLLLTS